MHLLLAGHTLRRVQGLLLLMCVSFLVVIPTFAQNVTLRPPQITRAGEVVTSVLVQPDEAITLRWVESISGLDFKIGTEPGQYGILTLQMRGDVSSSFTPDIFGLSAGTYYGVLTNSNENTFTDIQIDASSDSSIRYSRELRFVVEAPESPRITLPRGEITEDVPVFSWESVPGVEAYVLVISSDPFQVPAAATRIDDFLGFSPVWIGVSPETTIRYGESGNDRLLGSRNAPPLVPGQPYYYTVLNAYSATDASFVSAISNAVVSFSLANRGTLPSPVLTAPVNRVTVSDQEDLTMTWDPVDGALSYDIALFETTDTGNSQGDRLVLAANTVLPSLTVQVRRTLRTGMYRWRVIANDREGAASVSSDGLFSYNVPMGTFRYTTRSSTDQEELLGVSIRVVSTEAGFALAEPLLEAYGSSGEDRLPVGRYELRASKAGFEDAIVPIEIRESQTTDVQIDMTPLSARITGQVVDGDISPVSAAEVRFENTSSGDVFETVTNANGVFALDLEPGSYVITALKTGYRTSAPVTLSLSEDQQLTLSEPFIILFDEVILSGRVTNQDAISVPLARIRAVSDSRVEETVTDGNGLWELTLTQGDWSISASKDGFVAPGASTFTLFAGDSRSNVNFVLIQQASRIEGTIRGIQRTVDGQIRNVPIESAVITAVPLYGPARNAVSDEDGRYVLDLGTGSWTVSAMAPGHDPNGRLELILEPNQTFRNIDFELEAYSAAIAGRVVDEQGLGIAGATITSDQGLTVVADAGGRYRLPVSSALQNVRAFHPGRLPSEKETVALAPYEELRGRDLLVLPNSSRIAGQVRTARGALAGVRIRASSGIDVYETVSDASGFYGFDVPGGQWSVTVRDARYRLPARQLVTTRAGQQTQGIDLVLEPDFLLMEGFVSSGSVPQEQVIISVIDLDESIGSPLTLVTRTGSDGRYALHLGAFTRYALRIEQPGFQVFTHTFTTGEPDLDIAFDAELTPSQALMEGRVLNESGNPLSGAVIQARIGPVIVADSESRIDGSFALSLEEGQYSIRFHVPGYVEGFLDLPVSAGQQINDVQISLRPSVGSLLVRVFNPVGGAPVEDALVRLTGEGSRTTRSDFQGTAGFSGVPEGEYELVVEAPGFQRAARPVTVNASASTTQTFVMIPATGRISGRVVVRENGAPIENATLRLRGNGADRYAVSGSDGSYSFDGLSFGNYSVSAQRSGFSLAPGASGTITFAQTDVTVADLQLASATGRITGTVQDSFDGTALPGVLVTARSASGAVSTRSEADGTYTIEGLESAEWILDSERVGYRAPDVSIPVTSGQTASTTIQMVRNQAIVTGRIRASDGGELPFDVSVEIVSSHEQQQLFTAADGRFTFESLPASEGVVLRTLIQRENYEEIERQITTLPAGAVLDLGDLPVSERSATISGNSGVGGATMRLIRDSDGATVGVTTSASQGGFEFDRLPAGAYVVRPSRSGYTFSPASALVSVNTGAEASISFSATSALAILQVAIQQPSGEPVSGTSVRISSLDRTIDEVFVSDANGLVLPPSLPLGLQYRIEPFGTSSRFEPSSALVDFRSSSQSSVTFTRQPVSSFITGSVLDDSGVLLSDVTVIAERSASERFETVAQGGAYSLGPMPQGVYTVTGRRTGFVEASRSVTVGDNQTLSSIDLVLARRSVTVSGRVLRSGAPVEGIVVRVSGPLSAERMTDSEGRFEFDGVPVAESGGTPVQITIQRDNRSDVLRSITVFPGDVGRTIELDDVILPASSVTVVATDGVSPLESLSIALEGPDGRTIPLRTNSSGQAATAADLDPGLYSLSIPSGERLVPALDGRQIMVPDGDSHVTFEIALPYVHVRPPVVASDAPIALVVSASASAPEVASARVVWQRESASLPVQTAMLPDGFGWQATLPAPGSTTLTYQIRLLDSAGDLVFASEEIRIEPVIAGRLENLVMTPQIAETTLRTGDEYSVQLQIRDGLGQDLVPDILARGQISWLTTGADLELRPSTSDGTLSAVVIPRVDASHVVRIQVRLDGRLLESVSTFRSVSEPIESVQVSSFSSRVRNMDGTVRLDVAGLTEDGFRVLLGNSISWDVAPAGVATISQDGVLRTTLDQFVGQIHVTARDGQSSLEDRVRLQSFAIVDGSTNRFLTDLEGAELTLSAGAVTSRTEISMERTTVSSAQQALQSSSGSTIGERVTRIRMQSDQPMQGDSLRVPARFTLPADPALSLFNSPRQIVHFDPASESWNPLPSSSTDVASTTEVATQSGDYAESSSSEGLRLDHVAALPSPFSPDIAPLRIGYLLESARPPAVVRIDILSLRGERVRTLMAGELQYPGRYGSRTSPREILWDGLTDDGKRARNGRYLIRIEASDGSDTVSKTIQVVLVK